MKKKCLVTVLCLAVAASLAGCDSKHPIKNKYVEVGKYKGVEVEKQKAEVTDDELNMQIQSDLQSLQTSKEIKDRAAKKGDTVNIDFKGYDMKNKAIDNTEGTGYDLELGSNSFIPGFEEKLVGMKKGQKKTFNITFPKDYQNSEELQGKKVKFNVKVNQIKQVTTPELNDKTVQKINKDYKTVAEYKKALKKKMQEQKDSSADSSVRQDVWNKIVKNSKIKKVPEDRIKSHQKMLDDFYHKYAESYQMEFADFLKQQMGTSEEDYKKNLKKAAKESVEQQLIVEAIAEKEDLVVSDKEYKKEVKNYVTNMGFTSQKELEEYYGKDYVRNTITAEKVMKFCAKEAKVKEVKAKASTNTNQSSGSTDGSSSKK